MQVLISNDDGIMAPGLEALVRAISELAEVHVVAPETQQSAVGHAISVLSPLSVHRVHVNNAFHGWSVDGRPADCVKLAMLELLPVRPDFVLSGINAGVNTGINVLYSGTVAAAAEGSFFGTPSMAVSLELSDEMNFAAAALIARDIFQSYVASAPAPGTCLNVNIPALDAGLPMGIRVCPQGTVQMEDRYHRSSDTHGRDHYLLDGRFPDDHGCPESDLAAIQERYVAITPLRFDMTDRDSLPKVAGWNWPSAFR